MSSLQFHVERETLKVSIRSNTMLRAGLRWGENVRGLRHADQIKRFRLFRQVSLF